MARALGDADDLNAWFNLDATLGARLYARTASFCTERSGYFDGFDQGLAFFNATAASTSSGYWMQPVGYVHAMLTATWADQALNITYNTSPGSHPTVSISSQKTTDGKSLWVRIVNTGGAQASATVRIANAPAFGSTATVWTLSAPTGGPSSNPPTNPTAISPVRATAPWANGLTWNVTASSIVFIGLTAA